MAVVPQKKSFVFAADPEENDKCQGGMDTIGIDWGVAKGKKFLNDQMMNCLEKKLTLFDEAPPA